MRSKPFFHRGMLAAAVLSLAACASQDQPPPPQQPQARYGQAAPPQNSQQLPPNGDKSKPPPPSGPNLSPDEAMNRIDANKDGAISLQEQTDFALREADARFARMDRNHDGRLTKEELDEAEKQRQSMKPNGAPPNGGNGNQPPPGPQSLLSRADTNHDGAIDTSENRAMAKQQASMRFQNGDKNRDGRLDRDELQTRPQGPPPQQPAQ